MASPEELLARAVAAQQEVERSEDAADEARRRRDQAIVDLYDSDGWSYARIAREVGISTPRVQQIVEDAHDRRRG